MSLWKGKREKRDFFTAMAFLLPNFSGFLVFMAGPMIFSLFMSFTNWNMKLSVPLEWVGLRNYTDLLTDGNFWFYFYNTAYFMLGIPFTVAGSLFLASMLVDEMRAKVKRSRYLLAGVLASVGLLTTTILIIMQAYDAAMLISIVYIGGFFGILFGSSTYRTMFYIPNFASGVATIVLWVQIFNPHHGLANNLLEILLPTGTALPDWLTSTRSLLGFLPLPANFNNGGFGIGAREAIMIMGFWMGIGGNNMILYIAAISNIPKDLYEAADIDGAGSFNKFLHITLPSVAPTTFFIVIMATIGGIQGGFQFAKIMTDGGPAGTTTTLAYYIFTSGFEELRLGYASAVAWVMFLVILALTLVNWKYGNRRLESSS